MLLLLLLLSLFPLLSFLCCWRADFLKRSAKQKWNWRLALKIWNKRTVETLIVNTPSEASTDTYPTLLLLLLPLFYFLCCCWVDCLKTSAIQKWNWRFAENGRNIRTAEALIINIPSEASTDNYPMLLLLMLLLPLFSFFVLFLRWLFENWRDTKMKLKIIREWKEYKNGGSADRKYAIRGSTETYPVLFLLLLFYFLCCFCNDCLNKNSTPKFLTHN